ncbi:MAG: ABC transporter permease [Provencibacterium sp.]|nr:ABC transporter permease [Provencibacterium sp.]
MSLFALRGAVELGLAYSLLAVGLYISYRIVNVADLTVDGSFTLGAAVCAVLAVEGHPWFGMLAALFCGALAGLAAAFLQTKMGIQSILAGILVMIGLYSVNLRVMGKPNIPLLGNDTAFSLLSPLLGAGAKLAFSGVLAAAACLLVVGFFKTALGLTIRATGDNEEMVRSSSINSDRTKMIGLAAANALVALSGAVIAEMQMFADANMGTGMVVIGLASIIIGETVLGRGGVARGVLAAVAGSVIYRVIIAQVLEMGMPQSDLKLVSALIVALAIFLPNLSGGLRQRRQRKGGKTHA